MLERLIANIVSAITALALVAALSFASSASGDCKVAYPDEEVGTALGKPEYAACKLDTMKVKYADILKKQVQLLRLLRAAYARQLKVDQKLAKDRQARLQDYDADVATLENTSSGLLTAPSAGEAPEDNRSHARALLKQSKELSRNLVSRIRRAKNGLQANESNAYCQLDFYFRLCDQMHRKLQECFKAASPHE